VRRAFSYTGRLILFVWEDPEKMNGTSIDSNNDKCQHFRYQRSHCGQERSVSFLALTILLLGCWLVEGPKNDLARLNFEIRHGPARPTDCGNETTDRTALFEVF